MIYKNQFLFVLIFIVSHIAFPSAYADWQKLIGAQGSTPVFYPSTAPTTLIVGTRDGYLNSYAIDGTLNFSIDLGSAAGDPVVDSTGNIYVGTRSGGVKAFTSAGTLISTVNGSNPFTNGNDIGRLDLSELFLHTDVSGKQRLVFGEYRAEGRAFALDLTSGDDFFVLNETFNIDAPVVAAPAVDTYNTFSYYFSDLYGGVSKYKVDELPTIDTDIDKFNFIRSRSFNAQFVNQTQTYGSGSSIEFYAVETEDRHVVAFKQDVTNDWWDKDLTSTAIPGNARLLSQSVVNSNGDVYVVATNGVITLLDRDNWGNILTQCELDTQNTYLSDMLLIDTPVHLATRSGNDTLVIGGNGVRLFEVNPAGNTCDIHWVSEDVVLTSPVLTTPSGSTEETVLAYTTLDGRLVLNDDDLDGDGVSNGSEVASGYFTPDADGDGLPDGWEAAGITNPVADEDGDLLSNLDEYLSGTDPLYWDTDNDSLSDEWEVTNSEDPLFPRYQIDSGEYHNCALTDSGVECWGADGYTQTSVKPLAKPWLLANGAEHTYVLDRSKDGFNSWGRNDDDEQVTSELHDPYFAGMGTNHSCVLDAGGANCWGEDTWQQSSGAPEELKGMLFYPTEIYGGYAHTCVLHAPDTYGLYADVGDDGITCWGFDGDGRLDPPSFQNPRQLTVGWRHACALDDNGVQCWGKNDFGQLNVPSLNDPRQVDTGRYHACVIEGDSNGDGTSDDPDVICWGANDVGQSTVPSTLKNDKPYAVTVGRDHTCALHRGSGSDRVSCWGGNGFGQRTPSTEIPVPVFLHDKDNDLLADDFEISISSDPDDSDSDDDGMPDGWEYYNLATDFSEGAGDDFDSDNLTNIQEFNTYFTQPDLKDSDADSYSDDTDAYPNNFPQKQILTGDNFSCSLLDNVIYCWGRNQVNQTNVPSTTEALLMSSGDQHSLTIDDTGSSFDLVFWGDNTDGEQTPETEDLPIDTPLALGTGSMHTCVVDNYEVKCWGNNTWGQSDVPDSLINPYAVDGGYAHTCALDEEGVKCWGFDGNNRLDAVKGLINPRILTVGYQHTCVLDDAGVKCWGKDDFGQVSGIPSMYNPSFISAGRKHNCAIDADGNGDGTSDDSKVYCWGANGFNQVSSIPHGTLSNPYAIAAGGYHSCALDDNGEICWGANGYGQSSP